jgi:hypothetical protein
MKGGKLKVSEIKAFLEASYDVNDTNKKIYDYDLDTELSNKFGKVFVNQILHRVVIAHRGTRNSSDWLNNLAIGIGAYRLTTRFKTGEWMQQQTETKYQGYKIYTVGHSQAGQLVHLLGQNTTGISVNPAYTTALYGEHQGKNEYVIRTQYDPVSSVTKGIQHSYLKVTDPEFDRNHNIVIPSTTSNQLAEHSLTVLDRLDPEMLVGRGKFYYKINRDKLKQIKFKLKL